MRKTKEKKLTITQLDWYKGKEMEKDQRVVRGKDMSTLNYLVAAVIRARMDGLSDDQIRTLLNQVIDHQQEVRPVAVVLKELGF